MFYPTLSFTLYVSYPNPITYKPCKIFKNESQEQHKNNFLSSNPVYCAYSLYTQILLFFFLESLSRASVSFGHHDLDPSLGQYVIFVFCILKFWAFYFILCLRAITTKGHPGSVFPHTPRLKVAATERSYW